MMPNLGEYATEVLLAYAVSLGLIGALIALVWVRGRKAARDLAALETRLKEAGHGPH